MTYVQSATATSLASAVYVTATLPLPVTAGHGIIALHRYSCNATNRVRPTGFTEVATSARSTYMGISLHYKATAVGGEQAITARTDALSNVNCVQDLLVIETDGNIFRTPVGAAANAIGTSTSLVTPGGLVENHLWIGASAMTTNAGGAWGAPGGGFDSLWEPSHGLLKVSLLDTLDAAGPTYSQSWAVSVGYASLAYGFSYLPTASGWRQSRHIRIG